MRALVLAFLLVATALSSVGGNAARHPFTLLSDIHYDPGYGTPSAHGRTCKTTDIPPMGKAGCDSPFALMESVFNDIATSAPPNSHLVFTGDWLRHGIADTEAVETFRKLTHLVKSLPHTTIPAPAFAITSLGNNDFIPDYYFDVNNTEDSTAGIFGSLLREADLINDAENKTFAHAAYYARNLPNLGLKFLVLNTLPYSVFLEPEIDPDVEPDPVGQFAWMRSELADAKANNVSVVLISHIPPTMNSFHCVTKPDHIEPFIKGEYLETMRSIVNEYEGTVVFQFYGHAHTFNFLADDTFKAPGIVVPAVSKIFGNHASYITVEYDDETRTFLNFRMRYHNDTDNKWYPHIGAGGERTFEEELGGPISTVEDMRAITSQLFTNKLIWDRFEVLHSGGVYADMWTPLTTEAERTAIPLRHTCSAIAFSEKDYIACLREKAPRGDDSEGGNGLGKGYIVLIVVAGAMGVGLLVLMFVYATKSGSRGKENEISPLNTEASA